MKKDYKHGELYAHDLLARDGIRKKDNDNLFMELTDLFSNYPEEGVKKVYQDIMFLCELPNGQMRGKLPPLEKIKRILDDSRKNTMSKQVIYEDYAMVCPQCGASYDMNHYRCYEGYVIKDIGNGYTEAVPCKDENNTRVGPKLVKEKLEAIPKFLLSFKD